MYSRSSLIRTLLIRIFHLFEQIFKARGHRGSDKRGPTVLQRCYYSLCFEFRAYFNTIPGVVTMSRVVVWQIGSAAMVIINIVPPCSTKQQLCSVRLLVITTPLSFSHGYGWTTNGEFFSAQLIKDGDNQWFASPNQRQRSRRQRSSRGFLSGPTACHYQRRDAAIW